MFPYFSEIIINFVRMKRKEIFQGIISTMQKEIPFPVLDRNMELPVGSGQMITVAGVRRCGKSSMLKIVANKLVEHGVSTSRILWVNFDDERLDGMSADDLDEVLQAYREMYPEMDLKRVYMFFDEIQNIEKWELFVLRVYKTYCQNIFLTGSNAKMLSGEIATFLRGWPIEFEAFPLSFNEYLRFKDCSYDIFEERGRAKLVVMCREYLHASSFPEVVLLKEDSLKTRKVQGYFNTMLFRDVMERYSFAKPEIARYFFKRLMLNLTKPSSINSIYNDIKSQGRKIDKNALYDLADVGCETFMFFRVNRWSKSLINEMNRLPKYYFIDNGMRNALILPQSNDDGKLLENAVFLHLRRFIDSTFKISYYSENVECDFVIQQDENIYLLIQVSWTLSSPDTLERELRGLKAASDATGCSNCVIITFDEEDMVRHEGLEVRIVPAWKWLGSNPFS